MLRLHMKPQVPQDYRAAYMSADEKRRLASLVNSLFDQGLILIGTGTLAISTPMTEAEVDFLVTQVALALERLAVPV